LLEFLSTLPAQQKKRPQKKPSSRFVNWLQARKKFNPSIKRFVSTTIIGGTAFSLFLVLPFFMWIYAAYTAGTRHIEQDVCAARAAKTFHTKVELSNGTSIEGTILDRSDKLIILVDRSAVHVITTERASRLLDTTDVKYIKCKAK
jgi:hypothetical protein